MNTKRISSSVGTWLCAVLATAALLLTMSGARANAAGSHKIYVCVAGSFKTLNLTTKKKRCPRGQRKVVWNVVGEPGEKGAKGSPGSNGAAGTPGAQGTAGAQGSQGPAGTGSGATGPIGPQGPTGAIGSQGALGPTGAVGPPGAAGPTGPVGARGATGATGSNGTDGKDGDPGATGATGPAGSDGFGGAYLSTSGGPVTLQASFAPTPIVSWLPLSGSANAQDADWNDVMQYSPGDVLVNRVRVTFRATQAVSSPFPINLRLSVYSADAPLSTSRPIDTFATCSYPLPPTVNVGDTFSCDAAVASPLTASAGAVLGANIDVAFPFPIDLTGNISTAIDVT